jgi:hypothetical protein
LKFFDDSHDFGSRWFRSLKVFGSYGRRFFSVNASFCCALSLHLLVDFVKRYACKQSPKIASLRKLILVAFGVHKETAIRRLHNVFGIDTTLQLGTNPTSRQSQESCNVAVEDGRRRIASALLEQLQ